MGLLMHTVPEVRVHGVFIHLPPGELRLGAMPCALLVCLRSQSWRGWTGKFPRGVWPRRCEGGISPSASKQVGFAFCRSPVRGAGACPGLAGRTCSRSRRWQWRCESGIARASFSWSGSAFGRSPARGAGACPQGWEPWPRSRSRPCRCESRGLRPSLKRVGHPFLRSPAGARSGASFGPRTGRQGQGCEECRVEEENEHCEETSPSSGLSIGNEMGSAAGSPGQGVQRKWCCSYPR